MKKYFLVLALSMASLCLFAQAGEWGIGINLGYGSRAELPLVGINFSYGITDEIRVAPSFDGFLRGDGFRAWTLNTNFHYLFPVSPTINLFPVLGATLAGWQTCKEYGGDVNDLIRVGANVGGGMDYLINERFRIGLVLKYSIVSGFDQFVPTINIMYRF